ncbi:hypothetical protein JHK82_018299 [Glycine max]|nr:hypothetical protein JHK85_018724 [Glycine max]KAG5037484.1 hypothetical protein JHK86_018324 [Glycine max]KAG5142604.1 hypothetical protein JHK82_018299 [Glycine max]
MASNSKSETFLQRNGYDFLLGSIAAFYVLTVPYTKVEESFNVQIRNKFGHQVEAFFVILTATQFHFLFYCTRPLPNILALGLVNLAYGYWFRGRFYAALNSLIFTTTVFRCDMLLLLCPIGLQLLLFQLLYVDRDIIKVGLPFRGGYGLHLNYVLSSIASLDVVKLYSAPSHNSEFLWVVILFYFFWKSWDYSDLCFETHAFHWYFTSALPRSLLAAFPLSLFGLFVDRRVRSFTFPVLAFILLYSKLPHKELRFIISSVPIFNLSASIASNRIYNNKKKMVWNLLFLILLGLLLMSLAGTVTSFMASYWNYPSGHALKKLHGIGFHNDTDERWVHIDTFSAMNGISRFCESDFPWRYLSVRKAGSGGLDNVAEVCNLLSQVQYELPSSILDLNIKRGRLLVTYSKEEQISLQEFQQRNFTFLINEHPVINGFKCLFIEDGFSRVRLKPGFPPIFLVKEPKVYAHGNLENQNLFSQNWPGCP